MGNFNRSFNRDNRSGGGFNRSRDREMYSTICSNCGRECQVPFKPNGSKPVFCSDCFEKNGGDQRRSGDRDFAPRRSSFERPSFNKDRNYDRPQYSDRPQNNDRGQNNNDQFASLNAKLDRIITLLTPKPEYSNESAKSENPAEEALKTEKKSRSPKKSKSAPVEEPVE